MVKLKRRKNKSSVVASPPIHVAKPRPMKLGKPKKANEINNCLTCLRWSVCKDGSKGVSFRCSSYKESTIDVTDIRSILESPHVEAEDLPTKKVGDFDSLITSANNEESVLDMIEKALESSIPIPPDLRVNDKHIPQAANFYEWSTDPSFAAGSQPPFPRQVELGTKLYAEWCPRCSDHDWFMDERLPVDTPLTMFEEKLVFLRHGKCPKCHATQAELLVNQELDNYYELCLLAGQRSSKSTSITLWESYNLHNMLKLASPSAVFGVLDSQVLVSSITALTFGQAVQNMWLPFTNLLSQSKWYQNLHSFLDSKGQELGEELYNNSEVLVRYKYRNLLYAPNGPNKRVMRGRTRFVAMWDEPGWFPLAKKSGKKDDSFERLDANGVYDALRRSLFTLKASHRRRTEEGFCHLPRPLFHMSSSPQSLTDFMMRHYRTSSISRETLRQKRASWDYNPLLKQSDFDEEYRANPVAASRDYECNPPVGEGQFLSDAESVASLFHKKRPNGFTITPSLMRSKSGQNLTAPNLKIHTKAQPTSGTILSIDVGMTNNSFGFSVSGIDMANYDPESTAPIPMMVYGVGEIVPINGNRISLTKTYDVCITRLTEMFDVRYLVSDRFQNAKIMSDLEEEYGVMPVEIRVKWQDFETFREQVDSKAIKLPRLTEAPVDILETVLDEYPECFKRRHTDHLFWQMSTVKETTGVTVDKGDGSTDDMFRTLVLASSLMQDEEVVDELLTDVNASAPREDVVAVTTSYSGKTTRAGGTSRGVIGKTVSDREGAVGTLVRGKG